MHDLLATYYAIYSQEEVLIEGKTGFKDEDYLYFIILAPNNKAIHTEQTSLAYYLAENGYEQTALPIPNIHGNWVTNDQGNYYSVVKVIDQKRTKVPSHGKKLGLFHQSSYRYNYEPQHISSYGQWKELWIDKCTTFEQRIVTESKEISNDYYRLLANVLPYIIGISENAIQYLQESEQEHRHTLNDQGTITFQRYKDQLLNPVIWHNELLYDHMTRDLAEYIRKEFLQVEQGEPNRVWDFLKEYQSVVPLSPFSWRLLYGRLIFPVHLYDCIEKGFYAKDFESSFTELSDLLARQDSYEQQLADFFRQMMTDYEGLNLSAIEWIANQ